MLGYHANWKFMGSPDKVSTVALQRHFSILLNQKAKFFCASKISSNLRLFIAPVSQNANMQIDRSHSAEKGLRTQLGPAFDMGACIVLLRRPKSQPPSAWSPSGGGGVRTQFAQLIFESKDRFCGKVHDQHIGLALSLL